MITTEERTFLLRAKSACEHKCAYVTRGEAKTKLRRMNHKGKPYRCPFCGYWHVHTQDAAYSRDFCRRLSRLVRQYPTVAPY